MSARDLDEVEVEHLKRLETALFNSYDLGGVVRYLEEKTYLKGDKYSFKDHEFQEVILSDTSSVINVQKCAQVGMSEAMARYALAVARVMPYFNVIMTMPFSADSENFAKTRLDPIITESPDLKNNIDRELDNSSVKGIGNSLLYMRGCSGATAALSVPADMLIHDELDRSDPDIVGQYQSRIKHSKFKLTRKFGTPTLEGKGIALEMAASRRHRMACICNHCEHQFVPSFHVHVKIPGYEGELRDINKYNVNKIAWQEAYLECPSCFQEPSLQMEHRKWICENPQSDFTAIGYYVTPFEVPNVVTIPSLVMEITKYKSWEEFVNQALGETANNEEAQLTAVDVANARYEGSLLTNEMHNMGIDVGQMCNVTIGRLTLAGQLHVVHKERVPLTKLKIRKAELKREYRVAVTVIDTYPETLTVFEMQKSDKNLFGAQYVETRKMAMFELQEVDKNLKEGKLAVKTVKISRNMSLDEVMGLYKQGLLQWAVEGTAEDDMFAANTIDMTRSQLFNKMEQTYWNWGKSVAQQDHYFHSTNYLHVACRLQPTLSRNVSFGGAPLIMKMKMTEKKESLVVQ